MIPVVSSESQQASLVIDTRMEVSAWLNGKPVVFSAERRDQGEPRTAIVDLPKGSSKLIMRLTQRSRRMARRLSPRHSLPISRLDSTQVGHAGRAEVSTGHCGRCSRYDCSAVVGV